MVQLGSGQGFGLAMWDCQSQIAIYLNKVAWRAQLYLKYTDSYYNIMGRI